MRAIVSTLLATASLGVVMASALAAQPAGDAAPKVPPMSREQALAYLEPRRLAPAPGNLVDPILRADADLQFHTSLGLTPLAAALSLKNYDGAEALIDAGARLSPEAASRLLANHQGDARLAALVKRARR